MRDNHTMTGRAGSWLRRVLRAPFTRRTWAELAYAIVSFPMAVAALIFTVPTLINGPLWAASAPGVRKLGAANRSLARTLLGEDVPPPPPLRPYPVVNVRTPDAERLAALAQAKGAKITWSGNQVRIIGLPVSWVAELTTEERIAIHSLRPGKKLGLYRGAIRDRHSWLARSYFALKLPVAAFELVVALGLRIAGLFYLTYPIWQELAKAWPGARKLRTLARGIHPSVLDNGLPDALITLAARSVVPVDLVTDIPERPSAAIETIAYFSAAELLANVAKHSDARHATLEAVHVPGLLRIRVTDDGHGGASPAPGGGLRHLAERVRTVDGQLDIDSPAAGPTVVTVELPSRRLRSQLAWHRHRRGRRRDQGGPD